MTTTQAAIARPSVLSNAPADIFAAASGTVNYADGRYMVIVPAGGRAG